MVEDGECYVTIEGVPEPADLRAEVEAAAPAESAGLDDNDEAAVDAPRVEPTASSVCCATFTNQINLLDLVADVQDIYRSFTANIATSQTATPHSSGAPRRE